MPTVGFIFYSFRFMIFGCVEEKINELLNIPSMYNILEYVCTLMSVFNKVNFTVQHYITHIYSV